MTCKGFRKEAPLMIEAAESEDMDGPAGVGQSSIGIATKADAARPRTIASRERG